MRRTSSPTPAGPASLRTDRRQRARGHARVAPTVAVHPGGTTGPATRRPLPGGRAVVGALLITASIVGVLLANRAASDGPHTSYLVLRHDVDAGARIDRTDLREERLELTAAVAEHAVLATDDFGHATALAPLAAGQLLVRPSVRMGPNDAPADPAARAFSFAVERPRALDGDIQTGERIDLLATYGEGADAETLVAARDVAVVRVRTPDAKASISSGSEVVLTVALADADAVTRLAHATTVADITIVRSTGAEVPVDGIDRYALPDPTSPTTPGPSTGSGGTSAGTRAGEGSP